MSAPSYIYKIAGPLPEPLPEKLPLSALDSADGFMHFSTAKQLGRTLNKYFKDHPSVTIIRIDYNDVKNEVCWELPDGTASGEVGGEGIFPHIYGRCMHKSDIESVAVWDRQDGAWDAALESGAAWLVY